MSAVSDNLATLRAYPLDPPGSTAADNVAKLRLLDPDALVVQARRILVAVSPANADVAVRAAPRAVIGATISDS